MKSTQAGNIRLKKALGFPSLFIIATGLVVSQGSDVSILQGAGYGGGAFIIAILIAYLLTLCYISSYSELALMMPKAGSISTYTAVSMGHFPAIIASISGYLAAPVFAGPAELMLLQHVLDGVSPGFFPNMALATVWFFAILNILGIDLFASIQNIITYTMLVTLFVLGFSGLNMHSATGISPSQLWQGFTHPDSSVFSLIVLALFSFMAFEMICPLIEESKQPEKNIPKAMFRASMMMLVAYGLLAIAGLLQLPAKQLTTTDIPHLYLARSVFGNVGNIIIVVLSITTTTGLINAVMAATARMLYGMAHHNQLPPFFKKLHTKWKTPYLGIIFLAVLISIPIIVLGNNADALIPLLISASTCLLVAYIIAHMNVILLRKKYPHYKRLYKTPFYPVPQIIGIAGMCYAIYNNAPTAELRNTVYFNSAIFMGITALYAFFWLRYKMKTGLFEPEPIDQAIAD